MKAMLLTEYNKLELTDLPEPTLEPDDVLIRVAACGICGSDIHGLDGSTGRRIPPLVMGHEAAGTVEKTGDNITDLPQGARVTFDSMVSCGKCAFCIAGKANLCENRRVLGVSCDEYRQHGAFAEFVKVPRRVVYPIPDSLSFEHAAMIEPVSVAFHAVNLLPIDIGDSVVVIGAGMIGLLVVQSLKLASCNPIIAVDLDQQKLDLAKSLGATHTFLASDDTPAQIREITNGQGAKLAVECVGATNPIQTAVDSIAKGAHLCLVGNLSPNIDLPLQSIVTREITLHGSCGSNGEYPACIDALASKAINVEPLISAKAPLEEGPELFNRLYNNEPGLMKVILQP